MSRFRKPMLQAVRGARWSRVLLFAAALVAIAGSFGLHPEPGTALPAMSAAAGVPAWTAESPDGSSTHGCFACLAHRNVSLSGLAVFAPSAARAVGSAVMVPRRALSLFAPRLDDGRAPPALA
ncbi:MAG: hypothetical protein LC796_03180 [Acidobacteria bacterium]|nr:hypothetical protein [Acidobacteriota bacterium]MCA1609762.1 hypothetical protein [Acidobacteriota bacterium]